jgi:hypothetical protein
MAALLHPAAPAHLPAFISAPGETDYLLVFAAILLIATVLAAGVLFFWLHALPERVAHTARKWQIDLVALLALLSLFTHQHAFWIAGLLLAFVRIPDISVPDFAGPLRRIAGSLETLASRPPVTKIRGAKVQSSTAAAGTPAKPKGAGDA